MQEITTKRLHSIKAEGKKHMCLTGISEVKSFNDTVVLLVSDYGNIEIKGKALAVQKFDTDEGNVEIEGEIGSFRYMDGQQPGGSFFKRLFK